MSNIALETHLIAREIELLLEQYPELAEDEQLRADMVDGSTDAHELLQKLTNYLFDATTMSSALKERAQALASRRARYEKQQSFFRDAIFKVLKAANLRRVVLPEATLSISKKPAPVEIDDEATLPDEYVKIERSPRKSEIAAALKAGVDVPGARLGEPDEGLTVRAG